MQLNEFFLQTGFVVVKFDAILFDAPEFEKPLRCRSRLLIQFLPFRLKAKAKQTDVQCLSEASSPWVLGFQVGDDCGEVGCPATSTKPECPGTCGNGIQDDGEQCDGAEDSGCPGACLATCACP